MESRRIHLEKIPNSLRFERFGGFLDFSSKTIDYNLNQNIPHGKWESPPNERAVKYSPKWKQYN